MLSDQMKAAIIRGAYNACGTFAVTFLGMLAASVTVQKAAIGAGVAALAVLGFRAGGEGTLDTNRALRALQGDASAVHEADIQVPASPVVLAAAAPIPPAVQRAQEVAQAHAESTWTFERPGEERQ